MEQALVVKIQPLGWFSCERRIARASIVNWLTSGAFLRNTRQRQLRFGEELV